MISVLLGVSIGMVGLVSSDITKPIIEKSSCSVKQFDVFEIDSNLYYAEIILLNNGDNTINKITIETQGDTRTEIITVNPFETVTLEYTDLVINNPYVVVLVFTEFDNTSCNVEVDI